MGNVGPLERIVNKVLTPVRISPTGVIVSAGGAAVLIGDIIAQSSDTFLVRLGGSIGACIGVPAVFYGVILYAWGVNFYNEAMNLMRHPNARDHLDKIIKPNLPEYCRRQACSAAAINSGFGEDFKRVNFEYTGPRHHTMLPGV